MGDRTQSTNGRAYFGVAATLIAALLMVSCAAIVLATDCGRALKWLAAVGFGAATVLCLLAAGLQSARNAVTQAVRVTLETRAGQLLAYLREVPIWSIALAVCFALLLRPITRDLATLLVICVVLYVVVYRSPYFEPLRSRLSCHVDSRAAVIYGAIALFALYLVYLASQDASVWADEAYTLQAIKPSLLQLLKIQSHDTNNPGYLVLGKLWSTFLSSSVMSMKLLSVLPAVLSLVLLARFLRREFSDTAAIFLVLLCAASYPFIHYAIELRTYMWAYFFLSLLAPSAYYILKYGRTRDWVCFLLAGECAMWMHPYALLCTAIAWGMLFCAVVLKFRTSLWKVLLVGALLIALFLPWLRFSLYVSGDNTVDFWIAPVTSDTVRYLLHYPFTNGNPDYERLMRVCYVVALGFALAAAARALIRETSDQTGSHLRSLFPIAIVWCPLLLLCAGVLMSILLHPMLVDRYLVPSFGFVYLSAACLFAGTVERESLTRFPVYFQEFPRTILLLALGFLALSNLHTNLRSEREDGRNFAAFKAFADANMAPGDKLIFDPGINVHARGIFSFAFPELMQVRKSVEPFIPYSEAAWATREDAFSSLYARIHDEPRMSFEGFLESNYTGGAWIITNEDADTVIESSHTNLRTLVAWQYYRFKLYYSDEPKEVVRSLMK